MKPRDAAAVLFSLKFANNILYILSLTVAKLWKSDFRASNILAHCVYEFDAVFSTTAMYGVPCHCWDGRMTTKSLSKTKHCLQF